MIVHLCLRTAKYETNSILEGPDSQWAVTPGKNRIYGQHARLIVTSVSSIIITTIFSSQGGMQAKGI